LTLKVFSSQNSILGSNIFFKKVDPKRIFCDRTFAVDFTQLGCNYSRSFSLPGLAPAVRHITHLLICLLWSIIQTYLPIIWTIICFIKYVADWLRHSMRNMQPGISTFISSHRRFGHSIICRFFTLIRGCSTPIKFVEQFTNNDNSYCDITPNLMKLCIISSLIDLVTMRWCDVLYGEHLTKMIN